MMEGWGSRTERRLEVRAELGAAGEGDGGDSSTTGPRLHRRWGHICAAERGDNHQRCGCGEGRGRMWGEHGAAPPPPTATGCVPSPPLAPFLGMRWAHGDTDLGVTHGDPVAVLCQISHRSDRKDVTVRSWDSAVANRGGGTAGLIIIRC